MRTAVAVQSDEYPLDFNPRQKNPNHAIDWQQSLTQSGAKGESLWTCPSARVPDDWPKNDTYLYYGYNSYGLGDNSHSRGAGGKFINQESGYQPVKRTTVQTPSEFILIGDGFTGNSEVILDGKNLIWRNPDAKETGNSTTRSQARHTTQGNILFGDSHVEAIPLKQLFSDPPHQARVVWNVDGRD